MEARNLHPIAEPSTTVRLEDHLRLLMTVGLQLSNERSPDAVAQIALDAGRALAGAAHGAFMAVTGRAGPGSGPVDKLSGIDPALARSLPVALPLDLFGSGPGSPVVIRLDDIAQRSELFREPPFDSSLEIRSFLAVALRSRSGDLLGALLYGHPTPNAFPHEAEASLVTLAGLVAAALENLHLIRQLDHEASLAASARSGQLAADRRLRLALDATQLGTWSWNAATGLLDFDERGAELFGVPPNRSLSRSELRERLVYAEDLDNTTDDLLMLLQARGTYQAEYRIKQPDGSLRWIASSGTPSGASETGELEGMIGTVQDISLRKLQEESLLQSEKLAATGRMAATIAHEINNPLEAVTNLIYLAKTDPTTPAPVQRQLEIADSELARVSQIAQQTLGFYRDTTKPVSIDVNELLGAVVELFSRKLAGKQLQVTLDLEPGLSVVGLQGEIRQVISNLLVNAIDASPANGEPIRIRGRYRLKHGSRGISVMISDQGSGIPTHVQKRLFTPFVTTKQSRGTGLGLWVTRGMVEKHGGNVCFRSRTNTPAGTVFRVYLPETGTQRLFASPGSSVLQ